MLMFSGRVVVQVQLSVAVAVIMKLRKVRVQFYIKLKRNALILKNPDFQMLTKILTWFHV